MPWSETDCMNERVRFIGTYLSGEFSLSELCAQFGVSRKTGYKWVERYEQGGVAALEDKSRAPLTHPQALSATLVQEILTLRCAHPSWGPRKLRVLLRRRHPERRLPASSSIGEVLRRNGLTRKRRRIRRSSPHPDKLRQYVGPNSVWCADFKGHFPIGDLRCHPLTISDGFSRYLLRCQALKSTVSRWSRLVFESAFREFGLPEAIRTDNGPPFSTLAPAGLSRLAIWWIRLGIQPERILPGRPDQNGRHERMHSTLKAETIRPPRSSFRAQQRAFDAFCLEYNHERPHEALGLEVPASLYQSSRRAYPNKLPEPEYPSHFEVRMAYPNGIVSFQGAQWYLAGCLGTELIGLEDCGNDCWKIYFSWIPLGIVDLRKAKKRGCRNFGVMVRLPQTSNGRRHRPPYRT